MRERQQEMEVTMARASAVAKTASTTVAADPATCLRQPSSFTFRTGPRGVSIDTSSPFQRLRWSYGRCIDPRAANQEDRALRPRANHSDPELVPTRARFRLGHSFRIGSALGGGIVPVITSMHPLSVVTLFPKFGEANGLRPSSH